ncbi:MAG: hypothetical protein DRP09_15305 [Candidatus Thorarchaeota archaeon]|nr:MAG: hypothetical protein DRP09_15305 [Candidatus Thorarchaeota archaeon]
MSKTPDFLMDKKESAGVEEFDMATLQGMIETYDAYADDVARAEKYLKTCKENFNRLALDVIPEFMLSHGMVSMKLSDGREVKIKEDISASVKDDLAFRDWLKERGEDAIIKVRYNMGKMSNSSYSALADYLASNDYEYDVDESIHAQTKKKYFKELLKEMNQDELPEWVTIYNIRKATVK